MSNYDLTPATMIETVIAEITADAARGIVPTSVANFSELHDFVDANEYGGFCDDDFPLDPNDDGDLFNVVQNGADAWLKTGALPDAAARAYMLAETLKANFPADDLADVDDREGFVSMVEFKTDPGGYVAHYALTDSDADARAAFLIVGA